MKKEETENKNSTQDTNNLQAEIVKYEVTKSKLIEEAKEIYKKLDYKKFEKNALEPFVKEAKRIDTRRLRKKKKELEFKISTQAFTPKAERILVKKINEIEEKLSKLEKKERAIRKYRLVSKDIEELSKKAEEKEKEIKEVKNKLRKLKSKIEAMRKSTTKNGKKTKQKEERDVLVSLEDLIER